MLFVELHVSSALCLPYILVEWPNRNYSLKVYHIGLGVINEPTECPDTVFKTQEFRIFLINMKYIMKCYRPLYVSIKITMMRHKLVDCQNKHKYSTSMFGDLH